MLVHRGDLRHVIIGKGEVENVEVLLHTLLVGGFRDGDDAALGKPAESHLRGGLAVLGTDATQQVTLDDAIHALATKRPPSHHLGAEGL